MVGECEPSIVDDAPPGECTDKTLFRLMAFLNMERIPPGGQRLLLFGKTNIVVIEIISLTAQIRFPGRASSSEVFGNYGQGSSNC